MRKYHTEEEDKNLFFFHLTWLDEPQITNIQWVINGLLLLDMPQTVRWLCNAIYLYVYTIRRFTVGPK